MVTSSPKSASGKPSTKRLTLSAALSSLAGASNPTTSFPRRGSGSGNSIVSLDGRRNQLGSTTSASKGGRFRRRLSESSTCSSIMKRDEKSGMMASTVTLCAEKLTSTPASSERSRVIVRTMKRGSGSGNILSSCDTIEKVLMQCEQQHQKEGLTPQRPAPLKRRGSLSDASASLDCGNSAAATKTSLRSSWRQQQQQNTSIASLIAPPKVPTDIVAPSSVAVNARRRKSTSDVDTRVSPPTVSTAAAAAAYYYQLKSIMRVPTLDESLASKGIVRTHTSGRKSIGSGKRQSNSSTNNACPFFAPKKPSLVSFVHIDVRLYERTLGDNPSCSGAGPPVTIGWKHFAAQRIMDVDKHEQMRCLDRVPNYMRLRLSAEQRWNICQIHHTSQEIYNATDEALTIRRSRMAAARDDQRWFSEVMMNAAVWSKKLLAGGNGSNHLIKAFVARDQLLLQQYQELKKEEQQQRRRSDPKLRTKWSPKFTLRTAHSMDNSSSSSSSSNSILSTGQSAAVNLLKRATSSGSASNGGNTGGNGMNGNSTNPFDSFMPAGQGEKEMSREEKEHLLKHVSNVRGCFRHKDSLLDLTVMLTNDHSEEEEEEEEIVLTEKSRRSRRRRASFSTPSDVISRKSGRHRNSMLSSRNHSASSVKGEARRSRRRRSRRKEPLSASCDLPKQIQVLDGVH